MQQQGRKVAVLDPILDRWPDNFLIFSTIEDLIEFAQDEKNKNFLLIIDESSIALDRFDPDHLWLGKTSRHSGHATVYIGQDWVDVPKGIRTQCTLFFVFCCQKKEAQELANRFDDEKLLLASKLQKFEFIRVHSPSHTVQRGRVDRVSGKIFLEK